MPLQDHELPPHLAPLVHSEWGIWRWFVLRGAGFPANLVMRLSESCCASAADALVSAEMHTEDQFQAAIRRLNKVLDCFTAEGRKPEDSHFRAVLNARRRLADRKVPQETVSLAEFSGMFHQIAESVKERQRLRAGFETAFSGCLEHQTEILRNFASDPLFQEAVIWQNWHAFETGIQQIAGQPEKSERNQRQRQHEELVANYAQRYCVKNDTIGFFGPVAWGRIESEGERIAVAAGNSLVRCRHTYFEHWAIDELAASLSQIEGMDWWIPPRFAPPFLIQEGILHRPGAQPAPLGALEKAVFPLCDGKNLPCDILATLQSELQFQAVGQRELQDLLRAKAAEGILRQRFTVPVEANAETALRQQLLRIGNEQLRDKAITSLDRAEAARQAVADSAGNPVQLREAMKKLENTFEEITLRRANRNPGSTYGARTLVYEDCLRDLALRITPELLSPAIPALSLLFQGFRWLMQSMVSEFHGWFRQTYEELVAASHSRDIPLLDWWLYTEPKIIEATSRSQLEKNFKQKWSEILSPQQHEHCVQFDSHVLKDKVENSFPDLGAGFYIVRYFCPDMMLAATDAEAVRRGDVLYVLGEIHAGKNSLGHVALIEQHPNRQDLVDAMKWDLSPLCFKIVEPQEDESTTVRTAECLFHPANYFVATTPGAVPTTGFMAHPINELLVRVEGGELMVVDRTGSRRFRIMEAFADLFFGFVMTKAFLSQPGPHVPRVLIDKLVIQRETWRIRADELAFAMEKDEAQRFLGARKWMSACAVPQRMFVKSTMEKKPFYLDMASPVLVEVLCRMVRRVITAGRPADEFVFSEMLPDIENTWLPDASGATYTCELRFAVVDLKARAYFHHSA